ncbi:MAG: ADOP family duplicated permease, partial [Gammaproteobacteria bacterium]
AIAVIVILALGIGANATTLGLLYQNFLAPLPYANANQLVRVTFNSAQINDLHSVSAPLYRAFRMQAPALENAALFNQDGFNLTAGQRTSRVTGIVATASLFPTLGVKPLLGRVYSESSEQPGAQPVIVLSYQMWDELLHRDPQVIGQTLRLNNRIYTIIGVMPQGFWFPSRSAIFWAPLSLTAKNYAPQNIGNFDYNMIARLKPGADVLQFTIQANAILNKETTALVNTEDRQFMQSNQFQARPKNWRSTLVGGYHQSLMLMQAATGLLVLLVWFNLANLFVTRALARRGELVLRRVLGAGSKRLFTELLIESATLCVLGAALGLLLGRLLLTLLNDSGLAGGNTSASQGWLSAIGFAGALGLLSTLVFAVAGFYFVRRQNLSQALREGDAHASHGRGERRIRSALVIVQVALACGLTGMGLMLARSMLNLDAVSLGFQPEHVVTFQVTLPVNQYSNASTLAALSVLHTKLATLAGVSSASIASHLPFDHSMDTFTVYASTPDQRHHAHLFTTIADSSYFKTLDLPLLAGRGFNDPDTAKAEGVAVIDTLAARQLFGTTDALGRELSFDSSANKNPDSLFRVVGIVSPIHRFSVAQAPDLGSIYVDRKQVLGFPNTWWNQERWFVSVRTPLSLARILPLIHDTVAKVLPGVPMYDVKTLDARLADHLAPRRGLFVIVAFFSLSALLLAAVGLYAVQSYTVSQRIREFGIRSALGADRSRLLRLVLTEAGRLLVIGLILGLAGMVVFGQLFASALYGVSPLDPLTGVIVLGILAVTLLFAAWLPAWRASRVPPMEALRE